MAPAYGIENDLKYIRRTGTRSLTVTSYLKYLTRPQSLDVVRETGSQRQTIADRAFYMNHNAAFGTQAGGSPSHSKAEFRHSSGGS